MEKAPAMLDAENARVKIDHFLNDFDYAPIEQLSREERRKLQESEDPEKQEQYHRYKKNMFRVNNLSAALLWIDHIAAELLPAEKNIVERSRDLVNRIRESGANKGAPVTADIVEDLRALLLELKKKL